MTKEILHASGMAKKSKQIKKNNNEKVPGKKLLLKKISILVYLFPPSVKVLKHLIKFP